RGLHRDQDVGQVGGTGTFHGSLMMTDMHERSSATGRTTFRLNVEYDGAEFHGWQRQSGHRSVQGVLEAACSRLAGTPVVVRGAGRTDAGTHALGQVAAVTLAWKH